MPMKNAYECKEQFNGEGKCLSRERAIGPIVIWAIVVLIAMATGQQLDLPSIFSRLFR
jgi:hypothetical protein